MIWPLRNSTKSSNRTASSPGNDAWVLVRRRNSLLIRTRTGGLRLRAHRVEPGLPALGARQAQIEHHALAARGLVNGRRDY